MDDLEQEAAQGEVDDVYDQDNLDVVEGVRDKDLGPVFVDIAKRDQEEDTYVLNIMVYLKPEVRRQQIQPALQRTCLDVFGEDSSGFERIFYNQDAIKQKMGNKIKDLDNFEITITWPKAKLYSVDKLESIFIPELKRNLDQ